MFTKISDFGQAELVTNLNREDATSKGTQKKLAEATNKNVTWSSNNTAVATVTNGALDELNAKFITIDDVACVSFTAPHFSPYAVYVDTTNLSAGAVADTTPKTGDGIHPKWFLSIGL